MMIMECQEFTPGDTLFVWILEQKLSNRQWTFKLLPGRPPILVSTFQKLSWTWKMLACHSRQYLDEQGTGGCQCDTFSTPLSTPAFVLMTKTTAKGFVQSCNRSLPIPNANFYTKVALTKWRYKKRALGCQYGSNKRGKTAQYLHVYVSCCSCYNFCACVSMCFLYLLIMVARIASLLACWWLVGAWLHDDQHQDHAG